MKVVFLVMYLWHSFSISFSGNSNIGGPALTITPMPSKEICEQVGEMVRQKFYTGVVGPTKQTNYYWCIEVK